MCDRSVVPNTITAPRVLIPVQTPSGQGHPSDCGSSNLDLAFSLVGDYVLASVLRLLRSKLALQFPRLGLDDSSNHGHEFCWYQ